MPASDQETNQNQPGSNQGQIFKEKQDVAAEICCPICFEEMVAPKKILCCTNGKQFFFLTFFQNFPTNFERWNWSLRLFGVFQTFAWNTVFI